MIKRLRDGRYLVKYPSHRSDKDKIVYRTKIVGYSKRKADEADKKLLTEFKDREARGIPHSQKERSVKELLNWFLKQDDVKRLKSYKNLVGRSKPVIEYFGDSKVDKLLPADIVLYQQWRGEQPARRHNAVCDYNISNATINRELALLRQACNKGIINRKVKNNPVKGVKQLKEKERDVVISREDFDLLRLEMNQNVRDISTISYYTGMRYDEIVSLDARQVDRKKRLIYLTADDTKTSEARKVPFLSDEVDEIFSRRAKIHGPVFDIKSIRTNFTTACRNIGLTGFRFHDFRHTAATNMRLAGIDTATTMKICGWKSVAMFLKYNNVSDEDLDKASEAIAKAEEERLTSLAVNA